MFKPVKVPFKISSSIEETENHIKVKVSVTPYDGYNQEKIVLLDYVCAVNILKEAGMQSLDCLNKEVKLNNKKKHSGTVEWIFAKKQLKKNNIVEKVLDKVPEYVIINKKEVEVPVATKTETRKKRRKPTKKTHKLLGDEDVGGVLV